MPIDAHVHFLPQEHIAALTKAELAVPLEDDGQGDRLRVGHLDIRLAPAFTDVQALLRELDARRTDMAVLSVVPPSFCYESKPDVAANVAVAANHGLLASADEGGQRLAWMATLPLQAPERAAAMLEEAASQGAVGALIGTNVNGQNLDDPSLTPLFEAAEASQMFLLVHAEGVLGRERLGHYYFANLIGNPYETGLAVGSIIAGGILDKFPKLQIGFCHAGGAAAMIASRWDRGFEIGRMGEAKLTRKPSEYFRSLWFDTLAYASEQVHLLASLAGTDRIFMGTDLPFPLAEPDPVGQIERFAWATSEERAAMADGNVKRLLNLD